MYGLGELGAGATIEFWGPPVVVGVGAAAIAIGSYSLAQKYISGNSSYHAVNSPYPGPGMSYDIYQEATQNSYKTDPDFNGNWKGTIGTIAVSIGILNWINGNASGIEGQGPTNLDLLMAINKWVQDSSSKKSQDVNAGKNQQQQAIVQKDYISAPSYISSKQRFPSSSLQGTSANNRGSESATPSCGKLCK